MRIKVYSAHDTAGGRKGAPQESRREDSPSLLIAAQDILRGEEKHVVRLTYVAHTEGEPSLDLEENIEYRWCTFSELSAEEDLDVYVMTLLKTNALTEIGW